VPQLVKASTGQNRMQIPHPAHFSSLQVIILHLRQCQ
jgi:hypothetical protein